MSNDFKIAARNLAAGEKHPDVPKVQAFLQRFGYLPPAMADAQLENFEAPLAEGLKLYQKRHRLAETGILDEETVTMMEKPRCGVPDIPNGGGMFGDFVLRGCSYQGTRRVLSYAFVNGTADLPNNDERAPIRAALASWAAETNIDFVEVATNQNPVVTFGWFAGSHGDNSSFDGAGNTLAHAFYPPPCGGPHAGKCHFDEAETWGLNHGAGGFDLQTVALHELGHILGLNHSDVPGSVMFPTYGGERRTLTADDIAGARAMYGKRGLPLKLLVHLQGSGDNTVRDNEFGGSRGQSRRLEGFQLDITGAVPNLSCRYMAHLQGSGDVPFVNENQFIGTRGQSRRLEGFAIELTGSAASQFNVFYMAHLEGSGDTAMHSNGQFCGTRGQSRRVEGMLVRIEPK